ncbi:phosphomannose isomerase type II C-terminal cupin domain [Desulfogranum mediterraneum]|uniref:phosphomannose isomerase type II C-terminal cupin domain n=1 Tax=Desulfogranum mediterraneum TaxID=160661 RepID=UPI00040E4BBF|nr:phosphomannose isomerase type II C-terminal cupin domain [Desulfogranum mediterraneum]
MEKVTSIAYEQLTEHRPWGSFTILADESDHKVKRIVVKPGQRLSLQRHRHRREHWLMVSGVALVTRNEELITLRPGEALDIALGDIHRVQNDQGQDVVFIEVQLGDYFGEDDIERFEDDYGRMTPGEGA